jgi:hypothetical protein
MRSKAKKNNENEKQKALHKMDKSIYKTATKLFKAG